MERSPCEEYGHAYEECLCSPSCATFICIECDDEYEED